jgi:hypothetical protein
MDPPSARTSSNRRRQQSRRTSSVVPPDGRIETPYGFRRRSGGETERLDDEGRGGDPGLSVEGLELERRWNVRLELLTLDGPMGEEEIEPGLAEQPHPLRYGPWPVVFLL